MISSAKILCKGIGIIVVSPDNLKHFFLCLFPYALVVYNSRNCSCRNSRYPCNITNSHIHYLLIKSQVTFLRQPGLQALQTKLFWPTFIGKGCLLQKLGNYPLEFQKTVFLSLYIMRASDFFLSIFLIFSSSKPLTLLKNVNNLPSL